jgi:hypothetical protein
MDLRDQVALITGGTGSVLLCEFDSITVQTQVIDAEGFFLDSGQRPPVQSWQEH